MRTLAFRLFLAIAFVGAVGTAAASEYYRTPSVIAPEGCASTVECGTVCAARPESCFNYCESDAAHSVECGRWAKAYHAAGGVTIAQAFTPPPGGGGSGFAPPPPGGSSFSPPPGGDFGSPPGGGGTGFAPPPSGSDHMMQSPSGSDSGTGMRQPFMGGDHGGQPGMMQPPMDRGMGDRSSMMGGQQGQSGFGGGQRPPGGMMSGRPQQNGDQSQSSQPQATQSTGIDIGGGVRTSGPGGCRNPQECQEFCGKSENKSECGGFADKFERPEFKKGNFEDQQQSGEQSGKNQEKFEEQRKRAEGRMLEQMKQGMKQMTRMVSEMERRIAGLQKRKVTIPADVTTAMAQLKDLVIKAQNITDPSEMGEIGPQIGELVQSINEQFGNLERLAEFPRMIAQANKMIRQFESQLKRLETRVTVRKLDVGDALTEAHSALDSIKSAIDAAKVAAAQGDAEAAFEQLQSGVFEQGDTIGEKMFALEVIVQAPQRIAEKTRELRGIETRIRQLERKGQDVGDAKDFLVQAKAQLDSIKALSKQRPLPIEEMMSQVEDLENVLDQIRGEIGENQTPQFKPYELQLPSGIPIGATSTATTGDASAQ